MFLLVTIAGTALGFLYAHWLHKHFEFRDWHLSAALAPVWAWAIGYVVVTRSVNMTSLPSQAVFSCAVASLVGTALAYVNEHRRARVAQR